MGGKPFQGFPALMNLAAQTFYRFLLGCNKEHIMSLVTLIDEVAQWLTGVMRIIAVNRNPPAIVYVFLENFTRKARTEDKKTLL